MEVMPIQPRDFGLTEHRIRQFDASVNGALTQKDLENPTLWENIAQQLTKGAEIRCIAEDMSFVAYGICTFVQGTVVRVKIISYHKLDKVKSVKQKGEYEAKLKGSRKWCVVKVSTGEDLAEMIPTQAEALRWIADYQKALAA